MGRDKSEEASEDAGGGRCGRKMGNGKFCARKKTTQRREQKMPSFDYFLESMFGHSCKSARGGAGGS